MIRPDYFVCRWFDFVAPSGSLSRRRVAGMLRKAREAGQSIDVLRSAYGRWYRIGNLYINPRGEAR
jgi:hypothetical protein